MMKTFLLGILGLIATLPLMAGDGAVAVYVVDDSPEHAEMGGECLPYKPGLEPGEHKSVLAIAKAEPGATILMVAYDREDEVLVEGVTPVLVKMEEDSKPVRLPAADSEEKWPYTSKSNAIDLYCVVFGKDDPALERLNEIIEWMSDSKKDGDLEAVNLHGLAMKNRINKLLREDYLVKFSGSEFDAPEAPATKAAVTRGTPLIGAKKEENRPAPATTAGIRRGLKTLDAEWLEDARDIEYEVDAPGILLYPITSG